VSAPAATGAVRAQPARVPRSILFAVLDHAVGVVAARHGVPPVVVVADPAATAPAGAPNRV
jgi:hypothetical protein